MSSQTIDLNGATQTIATNEDGASLTVISSNGVGGGLLVLEQDADNSTIDVLYNSLTINRDANSSTLSVLAGTLDVHGDADHASLSVTDGVMIVGSAESSQMGGFGGGSDCDSSSGGGLSGSTVDLSSAHFIDLTDNAQNATFDYIQGISTVELTQVESGQLFENLGGGDHIELATAFNAASVSADQHTITLYENSHEVAKLDVTFVPGSPETFNFGVDPYSGLHYLQVACFAAGTRIMTARGEVCVEELHVGDLALTLSGNGAALKPVRWIGERRIDIAAHPRPDMVRPVRIAAGAFADRLPLRDLVVSPDHALAIDGVLINAGRLLNGVSITQDRTARAVRYFHVELDCHDILLAEGMAAESYLDTGNRQQFANAPQLVALHPDFAPKTMQSDACLPFVEDGPKLAAVRERLIGRIAAQGYRVTNEPNLVLLTGGRVLHPTAIDGRTYRFALPETAGRVPGEARLMSRSGFPASTSAGAGDGRRLGVCVAGLTICRGEARTAIALDSPALSGFHPVERDGNETWRWTDGEAVIPAAAFAEGGSLEVRLLWQGAYWTAPSMAEPLALSA